MEKFKKFRLFNFVMGCFHLLQAVLMLLLSNDFAIPVSTSYLRFDILTNTLQPHLNYIGNLRLGPVIALFLFISSAAHFLLTSPVIYRWYVENLKKGINYARWIEYSLSSSVMIVVIALLVGVYDLSTLLLMFTLNAMMILFGLLMEVHNQTTKKTNWLSFIFGCIAGVVPWIVIFMHLFGSGDSEHKAPTFVYYIFFSIFLFFNIFAINMILQYKKVGKWKHYTFGEKIYILLSLVAKSALAWQVFAGTLRPV
jgi:hypothetical protein